MFGKQVKLFEILGFSVKLDASWIILALLITWSLAKGYFPTVEAGYSATVYWSMGIAGMIGLFVSLILHELSHSVVARHYGLPMRGITLFIFGGVAEMEEEPDSARTEFLMAIAGPIASFVLAGLFYLLAQLGEGWWPAPLVAVVGYLAFLNAILAVFNLIPAFPLDGGRVLRAALWRWKGDIRWATRISSEIGKGFGLLLIVLGIFNVIGGDFVGGLWWFLIGLFVRAAAAGSYMQLETRRALEGESVARFMTPDPETVEPDLSIHRLLDEHVYRTHHDAYPVVQGGRLLGCMNTRQIKEVPRDRWDFVTVGAVAEAATRENTVEPSDDAMEALSRMRRSGLSRLMVTEQGRLVGILTLKDMMKLLALKIDLGDAD